MTKLLNLHPYVFWFGLGFSSFWELYDTDGDVDNYMLW